MVRPDNFSIFTYASDLAFCFYEELEHTANTMYNNVLPSALGRRLQIQATSTARLIHHWKQPDWVRHAALFLQLYLLDLIEHEQRPAIIRQIGLRAERLCYFYRCDLFQDYVNNSSGNSRGDFEEMLISLISQGKEICRRNAQEDLGALLFLHLASLMEQRVCDEKRFSLADVARISDLLKRACIQASDLFALINCQITQQDEETTLAQYHRGVVRLAAKDFQGACTALEVCRVKCPWLAEPILYNACALLALGRFDEAKQQLKTASDLFVQFGAVWDKRLDYDEWLFLVTRLQIEIHKPRRFVSRYLASDTSPRSLLMMLV